MRRARSTTAITLAAIASLVSAAAWADPPGSAAKPDDPPPHSAAPAPLPPPIPRPVDPIQKTESGVVLTQILVGELVAVTVPLGVLFALAGSGADGPSIAGIIFTTTPLALGAAICGVGKRSPYYDASCLAPMGGAMVGSLATLGLVLWSDYSARQRDSDVDLGTPFFAIMGFAVLQPALAITSWQIFKHRRVLAPGPPLPPPVGVLPPEPRRGLMHVVGETTLPLVSMRF
jgi:hypothetical protein